MNCEVLPPPSLSGWKTDRLRRENPHLESNRLGGVSPLVFLLGTQTETGWDIVPTDLGEG